MLLLAKFSCLVLRITKMLLHIMFVGAILTYQIANVLGKKNLDYNPVPHRLLIFRKTSKTRALMFSAANRL